MLLLAMELFIKTPMMHYKASLEIKSHMIFIHIDGEKSRRHWRREERLALKKK
jgi:hypothetical protein